MAKEVMNAIFWVEWALSQFINHHSSPTALSWRLATLQIVATHSAWGKDKSWESPKPTQVINEKSKQEGNFCCVKAVTGWGCLLL